jgi:hypothetical protein
MRRVPTVGFLILSLLVTLTPAQAALPATIKVTWNTLQYAGPRLQSSQYLGSGTVAEDGKLYQFINVSLPTCKSLRELRKKEMDCITSLEVKRDSGSWVMGELTGLVPAKWTGNSEVQFTSEALDFSESDSSLLPNGSRSSLWSFPGINHSEGKDFLFSFDFTSIAINGVPRWDQSSIQTFLNPITITDKFSPGKGAGMTTISTDTRGTCIQNAERFYCMKGNAFPKDLRFRVQIKLSKLKSALQSRSWFFGTAVNPNYEQKPDPMDSDSILLTLQGDPIYVQVPELNIPRDRTIVEAYATSWLTELEKVKFYGPSIITKVVDSMMESAYGDGQDATNQYSTRAFKGIEPFLKYATIEERGGWGFSTLGAVPGTSPYYQKFMSCPIENKIGGLVSSNATATEPGPPIFNTSDGTLEYRVAAPHTKATGDLNIGTYSVVIGSSTAKCLWGSDFKNARASVSMVSDDGSTQVATSTFTSDQNGLRFNVSGFHYSSGSIKIKLTTSKKKSVSINCKKGKVIRSVSGANPKCPAGFKKVT